jgi:hypothetical protein
MAAYKKHMCRPLSVTFAEALSNAITRFRIDRNKMLAPMFLAALIALPAVRALVQKGGVVWISLPSSHIGS